MTPPGAPEEPQHDPDDAGAPVPVGDVAGGQDGVPAALDDLRAQIDALDRALLRTIARRMALVAEVATVKRQLGRAIRDPAREGAVFRDWQDQALALGLPAEEVEALLRLLLRASRDQQAALGTESGEGEGPLHSPPRGHRTTFGG